MVFPRTWNASLAKTRLLAWKWWDFLEMHQKQRISRSFWTHDRHLFSFNLKMVFCFNDCVLFLMCDLPSTRWVCLPHASASKFRQGRLYRLQHWLLMPLGVDASSGTERSKSNFSGQKYFLKLELHPRKFPPPFAKQKCKSQFVETSWIRKRNSFFQWKFHTFLRFCWAFLFPFKTLGRCPDAKESACSPFGGHAAEECQ